MLSIENPKRLVLIVFAPFFLVQMIVHLLTNNALVTLLPGDGCGQILNTNLQRQIEASLLVAYIAAGLFSFSFAVTATYGKGIKLLIITALISIFSFIVGGGVNLYFYEHLNACDVFFMGPGAPLLNFGMAGLLFVLTVINLAQALKTVKT